MEFNLLLSYAYVAKLDLHEAREAIGPRGILMIDSGAFTAHTLGRTITVADYSTYLTRWRGVYTAALTLDVIGDPKGTARNTAQLLDAGHPVLPVHTTGAHLRDFDELCAKHPWVAVGGIAKVKNHRLRRQYCTMLARRAAEHGAAIHVLGVGQAWAPHSGAYSYDSSSFLSRLTRGYVQVLYTGQNLIGFTADDPVKVRRYQAILTGLGVDVPALLGPRGPGKLSRREGSGGISVACQRAAMWSMIVHTELVGRARGPVSAPQPGLPDGPQVVIAASLAARDMPAIYTVAREVRDRRYPPPVATWLGANTTKGS